MTAPVVTEQAGKLLRLSSQEVFAKVRVVVETLFSLYNLLQGPR